MNTKLSITRKGGDLHHAFEALAHIEMSVVESGWNNRPIYDEDAGTFVPQEKYDPIQSAGQFAIIALARALRTRLTLTDSEVDRLLYAQHQIPDNASTDDASIDVERSLTQPERKFIAQCLVVYLSNIEQIYVAHERDLYDSDNHYTGKPLAEFEEVARQRAQTDSLSIRTLINRLSE